MRSTVRLQPEGGLDFTPRIPSALPTPMVLRRLAVQRVAVTCALSLLVLGVPRVAAAQYRFNTRVGRVTNGLYLRSATAIRVNPLGLFTEFRLGYRHRIFDRPGNPLLLRNTYWAAAASLTASPGMVRSGVAVEVAPLAVLTLSAVFERVQWLGTFNFVQSFASANEPFSDATIRERARVDPASVEAAGGWLFNLNAVLQAKVGDIAVRNTARGIWNSLSLRDQRPVFYDSFQDVLAPNNGWVFSDDFDLIYQDSELGLNIGARLSAVVPLYATASWGADGVPFAGQGADNAPTVRLGPLVSYTFRERRHSFFNAPTVFVLAQWWLTHRYRTGGCDECTPQGLPMIVLGFAFRGDS